MKGIFLGFLLVYFVDVSLSNIVDTFEFGDNVGKVTFSKSGSIGLFEKDVIIPVIVPECAELAYVKVDVDNILGPPHVSFEAKMSTVHIKYRRLQYSRSTYVVTAKSIPGRQC